MQYPMAEVFHEEITKLYEAEEQKRGALAAGFSFSPKGREVLALRAFPHLDQIFRTRFMPSAGMNCPIKPIAWSERLVTGIHEMTPERKIKAVKDCYNEIVRERSRHLQGVIAVHVVNHFLHGRAYVRQTHFSTWSIIN
jgi:hypothetical protein